MRPLLWSRDREAPSGAERRRRREGEGSAACQLLVHVLPSDIRARQHVLRHAADRVEQLRPGELGAHRRRMGLGVGQDLHRVGHRHSLHLDSPGSSRLPWPGVLRRARPWPCGPLNVCTDYLIQVWTRCLIWKKWAAPSCTAKAEGWISL